RHPGRHAEPEPGRRELDPHDRHRARRGGGSGREVPQEAGRTEPRPAPDRRVGRGRAGSHAIPGRTGVGVPPRRPGPTGLRVAAFAVAAATGLDLTRVRVTTPVLRGPADPARFRWAVTRQRWATLGVLVFLIGAWVAIPIGLVGGWCRAADLP